MFDLLFEGHEQESLLLVLLGSGRDGGQLALSCGFLRILNELILLEEILDCLLLAHHFGVVHFNPSFKARVLIFQVVIFLL